MAVPGHGGRTASGAEDGPGRGRGSSGAAQPATDASPDDLAVRPATIADLAVIAAILEEARAWLAASGIRQWTRPFDDAWLLPRIEAGEVWLADLGGAPVATVRLLWSDPAVWGEWDAGGAAYVHTLAVRRDRAGEGIGRQVLAWAEALARSCGARRLRLDCLAENRALVAYYLDAGFEVVGSACAGGDELVLFERPIGPGDAPTIGSSS